MTTIEAIYVGLFVGIALIIFGLGRTPAEEWIKDRLEERKNHKRKLVNKILSRLLKVNQYYKDFSVSLTDVDDLRGQNSFCMALQHLKAYPDILDSWNKSNELVKKINKNLDDLVKHFYNNIEKDIGVKYKGCLTHPINHMIEEALK